MEQRLCLVAVHAHPDDEASKGPATIALYHDLGVRTVLVCCTGGEEGDVLNPDLDTPDVRERLPEIRCSELTEAARLIGYDEVVMLGYRDSGMAGSAANEEPDCFWRVPLQEAVSRLVEVIRKERPQVVITYGEDQSSYPHPDHLRVHEVSIEAFDLSADADAFPEAGAPWRPSKLYYVGWSGRRILAMHDKFLELGLTSPFDERWLERAASQVHLFTTAIDISGYAAVRRLALLAHRTQIDPKSPFWFGLPEEVANSVHPVDEYVLTRSIVGPLPDGADLVLEHDLFEGVADVRGSAAR